jgi:hypothetical protein
MMVMIAGCALHKPEGCEETAEKDAEDEADSRNRHSRLPPPLSIQSRPAKKPGAGTLV